MTLSIGITFEAGEQVHSHAWKLALAHGARTCGDLVELAPAGVISAGKYDVTATWGLRGYRREMLAATKARGGRHLVLERGFIGDRQKWTALTFDGIGGRGDAPIVADYGSRFQQHHATLFRPWRRTVGRTAVILGQVTGDATTKHINLASWAKEVAADLAALGWAVLYRHHPLERRPVAPPGVRVLDGTLAAALAMADLAVTFNSTAAVDAVLFGTPAYSADVGSPAYEVTSHTFTAVQPDRTEWAGQLAWRQWAHSELQSGLAWSHLRTIAAPASNDHI